MEKYIDINFKRNTNLNTLSFYVRVGAPKE